ncbi:MAG: ferritin [bacterium]|nr:ferritin [bacterium]
MIKPKMEETINKQINEEMFSSYLYLSMAAYCETINLKGFAHWLRVHTQEEMFHGMKLFDHLVERGGTVSLTAIGDPKKKWDSVLNVFEEALAHEQHITGCINNMMDLAIEEKDHAARNIINWFVNEQVEEEDTFSEIVGKLKMIGDNTGLLLIEDKEMGQAPLGLNPYVKTAAAE